MPGPPPEHPHLRLLKGNPGKRAARSPPEAQRADVCPEPAKHLKSLRPSWLARRADWQSPSSRPPRARWSWALATERGKVLDLTNPLKRVK